MTVSSSKEFGQRPSHKLLATMDAVVGLACAAIIAVLIYFARHPKIVTDQKLEGVAGGIGTAVLVFSVPAFLYLLCSVGLFMRLRWAWWVSLILNAFFAIVICQDVIVDWRLADSEDVWFALIVATAALLHVVQPLWRWARNRRARATVAPVASQ